MRGKFLALLLAVFFTGVACNAGAPPINVKPAVVAVAQSVGCPNAQVGVSYSCTLTASGGNNSYVWTQPSGTVPPGLTWSASASPATTLTITGTPTTAGSYAPVFTACDTETPTPQCTSLTVDPEIGFGVLPLNRPFMLIEVVHWVGLSWTASTSTVVGYDIYRGTTSGGPYTLLNQYLVTDVVYDDAAVSPGQTYYYVATAVDSNQVQSAYSNEIPATIPTP